MLARQENSLETPTEKQREDLAKSETKAQLAIGREMQSPLPVLAVQRGG